MITALKKVIIPNYGPYIFGRIKPKTVSSAKPYIRPSVHLPSIPSRPGENLIKQAAEKLYPVYAAEEDILSNDVLADCTCAGILHGLAIDYAIKGTWIRPTAPDSEWLYSQVTKPPFNIKTRANDNGACLEDVLNFAKTNGVYSDGRAKIKDFSAVRAFMYNDVKAALRAYGWLYCGACLPDHWLGDTKWWGIEGVPNEANGHCFIVYGSNDIGPFVNSWGKFIQMTWGAFEAYCSESSGGEVYSVEI